MNAYLYISGLALIFFSPFSASLYLSRSVLSGVCELEGYIKLIKATENEITSYMTKQGDIFASFKDEYLEKCGFLPLLRSSPIDECSALEHALEEFDKNTLIPKDCFDALVRFAEVLGKTSVQKQKEACSQCLYVLEKIHSEIKPDALKKAKVYKTIGLAAGAAAVILFI
ncbi:MAG: hypothetical protein E7665_04155 [Ruminococcaceae bacterium]|nr:hypothetical protein [Oscillospiraceae bacterium]